MASDQIPNLRRTKPNPNAPVWGAQEFVPENPNPEKTPFTPVAPGDKLNMIARAHERMQGDRVMQQQQMQEMAAQNAPQMGQRMPASAPIPEEEGISMEALQALMQRPKPQPRGKK